MKPNQTFKQPGKGKHFYTINHSIVVPSLRVIDEQGEMLGIMENAEAKIFAQNAGKDLVLVAPQAVPPVAKVIDFKKFLYQEDKKAALGRVGSSKSSTKDVQLSFMISSHDLERVKKRSEEFLHEGHQVRVRMRLHGRQLGKKDLAMTNMQNFLSSLAHAGQSSEAKIQGNTIIAILTKIKHAQQNKN